jgi:ACR3 family arsenite efflux pump ArsB
MDLTFFMNKYVLKYKKKDNEQGQIITEFALVTLMCMLFVLVLMVLFYYFTEYGERLLDLVSIDYP